ASFEGVSYLGARSPMTQIAEQMKKIREDWRPISQGSKKIKTDNYNSSDRAEEQRAREEWYQTTVKKWDKERPKDN
ncbi:TPA: hypothetical protein RKV73_004135, partial [Escherichia coli]|nr:hypothetical protein [Escherichia coli]